MFLNGKKKIPHNNLDSDFDLDRRRLPYLASASEEM